MRHTHHPTIKFCEVSLFQFFKFRCILSESMNKKEAAEFLDVSEKTIERYKSSGKLSARLTRIVGTDGKSRQILDFKDTELQRLKQELSGEIIFPIVTDRHGQTKTQTDTDKQTQIDNVNAEKRESLILGQTQTVSVINTIFERLETVFDKQMQASERAQKLMLSIVEASVISGLPKSYIRRSIKDEKLKAIRIGRSYKIKRQELDKFVNNL